MTIKKIQFTDFCGEDYDEFPPGEGALYGYFNSLREDKNIASSSIWHHYSCINTVVKNKIYLYSFLYVFTIKLTVIKFITQKSCSLLWKRAYTSSTEIISQTKKNALNSYCNPRAAIYCAPRAAMYSK